MLPCSLFYRCAAPLLALVVLFLLADTCHHTTHQTDVTVAVFEDSNADGRRDPDEPAIPGTLIVAVHNTHGLFWHRSLLTNGEGERDLSAEYTHFFNVTVVPPCGYAATTDTDFRDIDRRQIEVGFQPQAPRPGTATVEFHIWEDDDGDGLQGANEVDVDHVPFLVDVSNTGRHVSDQGTLEFTTDAGGWAKLDLGNSCGTLWIEVPSGRMAPSGAGPGRWAAISYDLGTTTVEWGLRPAPLPTQTPLP